MTQFVVFIGDLEEGVAIYGPYVTRAEAREKTRALSSHYHTEILTLYEPIGQGVFKWEPQDGDEPHVLIAGFFEHGFKVYGPFNSFEHAEQSGGVFPGYCMPFPLTPE